MTAFRFVCGEQTFERFAGHFLREEAVVEQGNGTGDGKACPPQRLQRSMLARKFPGLAALADSGRSVLEFGFENVLPDRLVRAHDPKVHRRRFRARSQPWDGSM